MKHKSNTELSSLRFTFRPLVLTMDLNQIRSFFSNDVPDVVVDLASLLFKVFRKLGLLLGVRVPQSFDLLSQYPDIDRILNQLYKHDVVQYAYVERKKYDDEPSFFGVIVRISGRQRMGYSGYGKSLFSIEKASWPAIGEAIERWSLEYYTPASKGCRYIDVKSLNQLYNLNLMNVAGFSASTRKQVAYARSYQLTDNSVFYCCPIVSVVDNKIIMAPLQWFSFKHAATATDLKIEPVISPIVSTGAAVANNFTEAVYRGMLEVIERDAVMIYWHNQIVPKRINFRKRDTVTCKAVCEMVDKYNLRLELLYLKTDFMTHTVQAFVLDSTGLGPAVVCDSASGLDLDKCIERAVLGAVGVRAHLRSKMTKQVRFELKPAELTMENRSLWWSAPEKIQLLTKYLSGNYTVESDLNVLGVYNNSFSHYDALISQMKDYGYKVLAQSITPVTVSHESGLLAVMVKIPELIPLHFNEWEQCDFGDRLMAIPKKLNLESYPPREALPHPYV